MITLITLIFLNHGNQKNQMNQWFGLLKNKKRRPLSLCYGERPAYESERALPDFTEFRARLCLLAKYLILFEKSSFFRCL